MLEFLLMLGAGAAGAGGVLYRLAGRENLLDAARFVVNSGPGPWRPKR